ncbi:MULTISPECIES: tRNA (guanosine(46)-N7)-methyltransferase TrmB [Cyanophyceae]|uniref:tRNA (guanosine(46)-N7)-methyltransferase TrmB n=1 Tax=Cyanophyceae TaxID=3028117 RepID=UPI00232F751C|nr:MULTISPECIES: tRNA (guanosine(46)-N7)-methyltransferase TrmB [Cyanophyceae]MDB9355151.1 tRNA (guanosine(46)-N7)-methyltransferase TrmB [Nodularia spumigena CS-587/03]MDB9305012.1 tRNA (guanosine(46)-N7)-methyltransferase TrmB [Nodularia spumigena CS-591/12]MDB9317876.1 tRNA (guanosine(46)-N7)-methyltransferase TrmB [Nodularia spumigena CS-590/01A]MDB9324129.1 tRNA (guanosine(46)-N7)-methyltransferase TrmB [Nodularia spumigena CS-591/07A]MDB9327514.1 tRNA (guanosine(46)-N7)-methyltransferase
MAVVRVRQHVNPLAKKYQTPANSVEWEKVYPQLNQPLHLDIGCAKGRFLVKMAQIETNWNFLGLEIREPLVVQANQLRGELGLTNLHYLFCNVNNSLKSLLSSLPTGTLQRVSIQFPDPWFKTRHAKRRVVQPQLVTELADYLAPGGIVFLQSDIEFVATEMRSRFAENPAFERVGTAEWLTENPLPVPTEREIGTQNKGEPVYRAVFVKKTTAP